MHSSKSDDKNLPPYRGRFAPSPTGELHLGSLAAALASCLQARQNHGEWLVRIEDIDPPREVAGATSKILQALESHGFAWDGPIVYQKDRQRVYEEIVDHLLTRNLAYPCGCTRRDMMMGANGNLIYPGNCRNKPVQGKPPRSVRLRTDNHPIRFNDALQGPYEQRIESTTGDFVIRRGDGLYAYQLAVVVDDAWQEITEVVRGMDLIDSTPRQVHLFACLNLKPPNYAHIPVITGPDGKKLSKSARSAALDPHTPGENVWLALDLLHQKPPLALRKATPGTLWEWALANWSFSALKELTSISL